MTNNNLTVSEKYLPATKKEFLENCDLYLENDSDIKKYCNEKNIPLNDN